MPINTQLKHLGQKYMGVRPENHADAMFKDTSIHTDGNHLVPVSNFMNAQCMCSISFYSFLFFLVHFRPGRG